MMLGAWGNTDHDEGVRMIHTALDAGVNFVDTADVYTTGESEQIVGKALAGARRAEVVLATKANGAMGPGPNQRGSSRRWLTLEVEESLRRLGTDYIDLYQVHRPDPDTSIDETLGALTDLQRAGKIRYAGCSTFPAAQIMRSHWVSDRDRLIKFSTDQPPYSILERTIENEVLPVTRELGMGTLIWGPLAGGWLSGRYRLGAEQPDSHRSARLPTRYDMSRPENQAKLEIVEQLALLADEAGLTLIQLALAFSVNHPGVTSAIIGPRTPEHLQSYLDSADVVLTADVLDRIDAIVAPGADVTNSPNYRGLHLTDAADRRR
jgi:aryl-alcohol dehydrogenase-like predicted oxidoreductase